MELVPQMYIRICKELLIVEQALKGSSGGPMSAAMMFQPLCSSVGLSFKMVNKTHRCQNSRLIWVFLWVCMWPGTVKFLPASCYRIMGPLSNSISTGVSLTWGHAIRVRSGQIRSFLLGLNCLCLWLDLWASMLKSHCVSKNRFSSNTPVFCFKVNIIAVLFLVGVLVCCIFSILARLGPCAVERCTP